MAAIGALFRFRLLSLKTLTEEDAFDDNLLLIGLLGMLFYDMFLLVPAIEAAITADEPHMSSMAGMFVAKAILEMVQALMQVSSIEIYAIAV